MDISSFFKFMPSTVDWCEKNYEISPFVAEFYNSITGACIFLSMYSFKCQNPDLFNKMIFKDFAVNMNSIYMYSFLISIGTILFHSTLFYPFQLLDELPLILIMSEYINILYKVHNNLNENHILKFLMKKSKMLANISCLLIPFTYLFSNNLQIISFHGSLKIFEFTIFLSLYTLSYKKFNRESNEENKLTEFMYKKHTFNIKDFSYKGISIYTLSVMVWLIEKFYCSETNFELHALWHMLSSLGFLYFNEIISSHIYMYYLLKNNNEDFEKPPPPTPSE